MAIPAAETDFLEQVDRFRRWANSVPEPRSGEWECDYENWPALTAVFVRFLEEVPPYAWSREATGAVLYAVARDNEIEGLADELMKRPEALRAAGRALATSDEPDAKWQVGSRLAQLDREGAIPLLSRFALDSNEYVSRRALLELARLKAPVVEQLAERAWETGHEYQRIAALHALADSGSPRLVEFLVRAEQDGRRYVVEKARELRSKQSK